MNWLERLFQIDEWLKAMQIKRQTWAKNKNK